MDNLIVYPEDYYYGIDNTKKSIKKLEDIIDLESQLKQLCVNSEIDLSNIYYSSKRVKEKLDELLVQLIKIKKIMIKMDPSIDRLYNELEKKYNYINYENENEREYALDLLKGINKDTGANVVVNGESIFNELKYRDNVNKLLDMMKGNNKENGSIQSLNYVSVINGEMK